MNIADYQSTVCCPTCKGTKVVQVLDQHGIGWRMKTERMKRGIKLRELAEAMCCTSGYLAALEQGRNQWDQAKVNKVIELLQEIERRKEETG